jgi:putative hydrolase of the HAD superfamily
MKGRRENRCVLFDWGDTLMRVFPEFDGPMFAWPRVEALPYAIEALSQLHPLSILALATNADASEAADIWAALERVGLKGLLDRVYCFRVIGYKKSSPEFFKTILADLGMDRSQVVMVGDDFDSDVIGANRCGIRAIWLNERTDNDHNGESMRTIHSLHALPGALNSMWEQ